MRRLVLSALLSTFAAATATAQGTAAIHTNTERVEALAADATSLWVASEGGLERFDRATGRLLRKYTTADGLAATHVHGVTAGIEGVVARARTSSCTLDASRDVFVCAAAPPLGAPEMSFLGVLDGHRVTARIEVDGTRFVGTAGAGVYRDGAPPFRLTPGGQICSNHVTDVVEHDGAVVIGTFNDGLCVEEANGFRPVAAPFRMVNALASTPLGLYVATSDGLFVTRDLATFTPHPRITDAVSGLAFDGRSLHVAGPAVLYRLRLRGGPAPRATWRPGGSVAVQDLALGPDGTIWLATEDLGIVRLRGEDAQTLDCAAGLPTSWTLGVDVGSDGTAWVATLRHGLVAIAPDGSFREVPVPDAWLLRVRAEGGRVLVGTQGGAFDVGDEGTTPIAGIPDPRVHEIRRIRGRLYVGTEGGMLVTTPA